MRITQIMNLLKLAPKIQECLLELDEQKTIRFFTERRLRPLIRIEDTRQQMWEFKKMLSQVQDSKKVAGNEKVPTKQRDSTIFL